MLPTRRCGGAEKNFAFPAVPCRSAKVLRVCVTLGPLLLFFVAAAGAQPDPRALKICGEANRIAVELNKISSLTLRHPVPCDFITYKLSSLTLRHPVPCDFITYKISSLTLRHPVPCDFITKEKINEFLNKRVKEVAKPEDIRAEELALTKFGLVPPAFDLAKNTVDLLTEQAAAFCDYDKKKLFLTESTPSDTQEPVLAHELSHALADQNFHLSKFICKGRKSDDGASPRLPAMGA